jgi:hypothetical protein
MMWPYQESANYELGCEKTGGDAMEVHLRLELKIE